MQKDKLVWVDLEAFGLSPVNDPILEVGFKVTDLDLQEIDSFQCLVWQPSIHSERYDTFLVAPEDEFVREMHTKSGLLEEAVGYGLSYQEATQQILEFLDRNEVDGEPLCGSSVHYDRSMLEPQFPLVFERFHYRIIDTSVLKGLCERYAPDIYNQMPNPSRKLHRVKPDIEDTIDEFRFYADNFLFVTI